jgi:transcriptional regulator with XRE-family HTH domain
MTGNREATDSDVEIGARLRALRVNKGMSQQQLGELLGVSFQQVQKYEKGINRVAAARLVEIAHHLETNVEQLLGVDSDIVVDHLFSSSTYKTAKDLHRLYELSPRLMGHFHSLVTLVVEEVETAKGPDGRPVAKKAAKKKKKR